MQLNWSLGISLYMLAGGLLVDYKVQKVLKNDEYMKELYSKFPSPVVDMVYNRAFVFAMGCIMGLPGYLIAMVEKFTEKKEDK